VIFREAIFEGADFRKANLAEVNFNSANTKLILM
jgi:uncharacterized protein YjbI with pentapeptide repeats